MQAPTDLRALRGLRAAARRPGGAKRLLRCGRLQGGGRRNAEVRLPGWRFDGSRPRGRNRSCLCGWRSSDASYSVRCSSHGCTLNCVGGCSARCGPWRARLCGCAWSYALPLRARWRIESDESRSRFSCAPDRTEPWRRGLRQPTLPTALRQVKKSGALGSVRTIESFSSVSQPMFTSECTGGFGCV